LNRPHVTDRTLENTIATLLRLGVTLAGTVVASGGILYLLRHGSEVSDFRTFKMAAQSDRLVPDIFSAAFHGRARSIIQLGILLLIATPIARVAVSLAGFAFERDRKYVIITAIVLTILIYSLFSGAQRG
jgi:uncharacterized membrane protein